jgi:hypothetical protein
MHAMLSGTSSNTSGSSNSTSGVHAMLTVKW